MARIYSVSGESKNSENLQPNLSEFRSDNKEKQFFTEFLNEEINNIHHKSKSTKSRLKSPQELVNTTDIATLGSFTQHQNSHWILSFLNIFHWTLLVPNGIKYDNIRGGFCVKESGILIKLLSYLWMVCLCGHVSLIYFSDSDQSHTVKSIVVQVTWFCYTFFDITAITCLRTNGKEIATLLTEGNDIYNLLDQISGKDTVKKRNCFKFLTWILSGLTIIFTICFIIFVVSAYSTNLYNLYLNHTSPPIYNGGNNVDDLDYPCTSSKEVLCNLIQRATTSAYACALLILWFLVAFSTEIIWIAYLLMTASWGFYFKRMFANCMEAVRKGKVDLLDGIRIYTRISLLLEDYNRIFGNTLLWIVTASIFSTAITLGGFLGGFTNELMFDIVSLMGYVPFIATVYTASELHKTGSLLPTIFKKQFLYKNNATDYEHTLELMQGTSVVQFDTLSNNVGLKGAGFFTISYTFVGSMIGLIITYSLVTVQLKLNEIAVN